MNSETWTEITDKRQKSGSVDYRTGWGIALILKLKIILLLAMLMIAGPVFGYSDPLERAAVEHKAATGSLLLDVVQAGDRILVVGERGHILYSDDKGSNWTQAAVPVQAHLNAVFFVGPEQGWAVGEDGVILHSDDAGGSWQMQHKELGGIMSIPLLDVYFLDQQLGFAIGAYGTLLHTVDGGRQWADWQEQIDNPDGWHLSSITRTVDGILFIAGEAGTAYRSIDKGASWQSLHVPHEGSFLAAVATRVEGEVLLSGVGGRLFRTIDSGDSWQPVEVATKFGLLGGTLLADGTVLLVGSDGVVLRGRPDADFEVFIRKDRQPISAVAAVGKDEYLMVGLGGLQQVGQGELLRSDSTNSDDMGTN